MEEYPYDKEAMLDRCDLVYFGKTFKDCGIELDEATWAACLLCMFEHFENFPPPTLEESEKKVLKIERDDRKMDAVMNPPQGFLQNRIKELENKVKYQEGLIK